LGTSFQIENPARNHYFGNIGRIGRSISESKQRQEFEQVILSIVTDNQLDVYNRVMFYFLFRNYNYYLDDASLKKENIAKLAKARSTLPDYISTRLVKE
jgi:precorrin-2 methylase